MNKAKINYHRCFEESFLAFELYLDLYDDPYMEITCAEEFRVDFYEYRNHNREITVFETLILGDGYRLDNHISPYETVIFDTSYFVDLYALKFNANSMGVGGFGARIRIMNWEDSLAIVYKSKNDGLGNKSP